MKIRIALIILSLIMWGCAGLQRPSYNPQGTYSTAQEYMSRPGALQSQSRKGPFELKWPVRFPKINRGYRPRSDHNHMGVDLGGKRGYRIYAAHDGVVVYAGNDFTGYGNMILLEYDSHWATLYAHLNGFRVSMGQRVLSGQTIGTMGRTGRATGVHLHFELLKKKQPVDPMPYLRGDAVVVEL